MRDTIKLVERRKHKRFEVPVGVFVAFRPHDMKLGEIIDISMGGLAFRYLATDGKKNGSTKLNILLAEHGFHLSDVKFETITDCGSYRIPHTSMTMRRSGVRFAELTTHQISQMTHFIQSYTKR